MTSEYRVILSPSSSLAELKRKHQVAHGVQYKPVDSLITWSEVRINRLTHE
ncbi:MAG: hypothetical protein QF613_02335 [Candidatus Marinimicrobia bacterium]|nr:hypothetical protein [Candidatus Neomarinimicrobiota bacterium]MDP6593033.1 hypothetical protein [Candidatus Neomarinimicrobiota bacterium]MDP6835744.1 hypothetical protein [Candidatus Neomarinimicrobiota bacterium]MDP6967478.1 hypothetical protein [Candidatus Neomarinimicrobiota bacterium]